AIAPLDARAPDPPLSGTNGTDAATPAEALERRLRITYPAIDDADGAALAALEGIVPTSATPTTVLLDRKGRVAVRVVGMVDPGVVRPLVDALLAEAP